MALSCPAEPTDQGDSSICVCAALAMAATEGVVAKNIKLEKPTVSKSDDRALTLPRFGKQYCNRLILGPPPESAKIHLFLWPQVSLNGNTLEENSVIVINSFQPSITWGLTLHNCRFNHIWWTYMKGYEIILKLNVYVLLKLNKLFS